MKSILIKNFTVICLTVITLTALIMKSNELDNILLLWCLYGLYKFIIW